MPNAGVQKLTTPECLDLLGRHHLGRFAFVDSVGVMPLIIPVNYLLEDDMVLFRTDTGSKLASAIRGAPVAFEVDGVEERDRVGWSVMVRGHAELVVDKTELARLRETPLLAWTPGATRHYVRIVARQVIGRRIDLTDVPSDWWA